MAYNTITKLPTLWTGSAWEDVDAGAKGAAKKDGVPAIVTDTTSSSANASPVDYDYVLSVDKDTKLAAIKNIKTNT